MSFFIGTKDMEFSYGGKELEVNSAMKETFDKYGGVIIRGILDEDELLKLKTALENDEGVLTRAYDIHDSDDGTTTARMCLWNLPGNDITGMLGRCEKIAGTMEALLGGEVYHYHTKLMMKEPRGGGRFVWHQDYGYWYLNGCLYPDMGTVFIAVDKCVPGNGCLHIIPGSHKCGRIEHVEIGGQVGADLERVGHLKEKLGVLPIEMNAGDALFFHSNLLHSSERNLSEMRRWAFLVAYNRASNNPVKKHHHPRYIPLQKVSNDSIKECKSSTDMKGKVFLIGRDKGSPTGYTVEDDHLL